MTRASDMSQTSIAAAPARKRSSLPIAVKEVAQDGTFEGYGSVFGVLDAVGDVVAPGAYAASLERYAGEARMPKLLWQHDPWSPIGVWLEMREDARGLWCRGRLILDVERGREAYALLKAGAVDALSIGFEALEVEFADPDDYEAKYGHPMLIGGPACNQVRVLKAIDLWEVSLVTFPACEPARIESVKASPALDVVPLALALARRQAALAPFLTA